MAPELIAGRYAVLRPVGRGGMGTVWLCRDELLGREVALKQVGVLPGESVPDVARALREARLSAALNHPHVVSVFDAVEADDHIWLVMEHVPGESLSELVAREGRLPPERVAAIGAQVAEGLVAAHARGTVHRDVKPGNVLVTDDTAKISDFGIARAHGEEQLTRSGQVMGTPLYFSPELARGADPSPAADVWALGATLYAAVEGKPPIAGRGSAVATLAAIAETRPPVPEHAGFLTEPIGRMLDPDPASRWTMADAAHALRRAADAHRPPGTLTMTGASGPPSRAEPAAPAPADAGTPERDRRSRWPVLLGALLLLLVAGVAGAVLLDRDNADPSAGSDSRRQAPPAERSASPSPSASTSPSQSPTASSSSAPTSASPVAGPARSVAAYYALLPGDPQTAWRMLGKDARAQAGGYDRYVGFWGTIDDVSLDTVSTDGGVVTVRLTYTSDEGTSDETRQLEVERRGSDWMITEDLGPVRS
ncbi:serine/threonine-protein kinase [Nocardioides sp. MAHUQ-72]|uniref:serine/threonine-protein kinase n=1 Tax=unclassified Nocardioides TaxID=2615069 RepID=UPI003609430B